MVQWAVAYLAGAWFVFELVTGLGEPWGLPDWTARAVTIVLAAGLLVVLVLAWYHGEQGRQRVSGPELLIIGGLLLVGGALTARLASGEDDPDVGTARSLTADGRPSVAVMPLENLSPDEDNDYFAHGVHDQIIAQLGRVETVRTIARQSVLEYDRSARSAASIGGELGVQHLLTGTARFSGNRVAISVQLVDTASEEPIWGDDYEEDLSDFFAVQARIATSIARALGVRLSPAAEDRLGAAGTENEEALTSFLRAKLLFDPFPTLTGAIEATALFERAIELDPEFVEAVAWLSMNIMHRYWWEPGQQVDSMRVRARELADLALELDPLLADAHVALAQYWYWGHRDYAAAERALDDALALQPSHDRAWRTKGHIRRRVGDIEGAVAAYEESVRLSPRGSGHIELVLTHRMGRDLDAAMRHFELARAIPRYESHVRGPQTLLRLGGDVDGARAMLREFEADEGSPSRSNARRSLWFDVYMVSGLPDSALAVVAEYPDLSEGPTGVFTRGELQGRAYRLLGRRELAVASFGEAAELLREGVARFPEDARYHIALGRVLAGAGRADAAVSAGARAAELMPITVDNSLGSSIQFDQAEIYAWTGDSGAAIEILAELLRRPSQATRAQLRLDPRWIPLRDEPAFQELLLPSEGR